MSIALMMAAGEQAKATAYSFSIVDSKTLGLTYLAYTSIAGINNAGEIVGSNGYSDRNIGLSGSASMVTKFSFANFTFADGVNNKGQITVNLSDTLGGVGARAGIDTAGVFTSISAPSNAVPNSLDVYGINDLGQAVGTYRNIGSGTSGFVTDGAGNVTTLANPCPRQNLRAYGINNAGTIVGDLIDVSKSNQYVGFEDTNGSFTTIAVPGAVSTTVTGINNAGVLTGYYQGSDSQFNHGFVDAGGSFTTLDVPGAPYPYLANATPLGINDLGQVVGNYIYYFGPGLTNGFVATPITAVPEPASITLFGTSLAAIGLALARRRRHAP